MCVCVRVLVCARARVRALVLFCLGHHNVMPLPGRLDSSTGFLGPRETEARGCGRDISGLLRPSLLPALWRLAFSCVSHDFSSHASLVFLFMVICPDWIGTLNFD